MAKFVVELLKEINEDLSKLALHKDNAALRICFEYAFDPTKKWILPDGEPPFKRDPAPLSMSPANFQQEIRRFHVFLRADLTVLRRETLFIQLLEGVHPSEADLLLAIKDQNLPKLYPNITLAALQAAGYLQGIGAVVTPTKSPDAVAPAAKRGRGRPSGAKNKAKSEDKAE